MAIVTVRQLNKAQSDGTLDPSGSYVYKQSRTFYFQVLSDSLTEMPDTVEVAEGIPAIGSMYVDGYTGSLLCCLNVKSNRDKPYHWTVEVRFDTLPQGKGDQPKPQNPNDQTDPRNWSPEIQTGWVKRQVPMYYDVNGNAVVNSCGQAIDPPPMVDDDIFQIRVARYEATPNFAQMKKFKNALNKTAFWGYSPGTLKLLPIGSNLEWIHLNGKNYSFWKKSYTFEATSDQQLPFYYDDWGIRPIDRGTCQCMQWANGQLKPADSSTSPPSIVLQNILDAHGIPVQKQCFLNGTGQPLPANSTPVWVAFSTANPPPNGQKMTRNAGELVDGYQPYNAQDFNTIKDADGNKLPNVLGFENSAKVGR